MTTTTTTADPATDPDAELRRLHAAWREAERLHAEARDPADEAAAAEAVNAAFLRFVTHPATTCAGAMLKLPAAFDPAEWSRLQQWPDLPNGYGDLAICTELPALMVWRDLQRMAKAAPCAAAS